MQITRPIIAPELQSFVMPAPVAEPWASTVLAKMAAAVWWVFDIDDGMGGLTCMVCVLAVFGVLVTRLAQLDSALDSQALNCKPINTHTLQMECKFE